MGDKMAYRVAQDDSDGSANKAWMDASGQDEIPTAFVIGKDSTIQWIGHPMQLDKVVAAIEAGTFDSKKAAAVPHSKRSSVRSFSRGTPMPWNRR